MKPRMFLLPILLFLSLPVLAGYWGMRITDNPQGAGVSITAVTPGGAAHAGGLRAGDLITRAGGRKVLKAGDLAHLLQRHPAGKNIALTVSRGGREKEVGLSAHAAPPAATEPAPPPVRRTDRRNAPAGRPATPTVPPTAYHRGPAKASIAVGDFQAKAAQSTQYIGDGLREMLLTSLHRSGYFIVVERMDIQGIIAEQALSRSSMNRPEEAIPEGQMDVADVMIYGVISEFEPEARGLDFTNFVPQAGMAFRHKSVVSEMAIDIRAVDVRTGRVLVAKTIPGSAQAFAGSMSANVPLGNIGIPVSLGEFRNTPMEWAIRDCIKKATYFVINNVPRHYFQHQ